MILIDIFFKLFYFIYSKFYNYLQKYYYSAKKLNLNRCLTNDEFNYLFLSSSIQSSMTSSSSSPLLLNPNFSTIFLIEKYILPLKIVFEFN